MPAHSRRGARRYPGAVLQTPKSEDYYDGYNHVLAHYVPSSAKRIVEVGCARGRLGYELKQEDPERVVIGLERDPSAAETARTRLDEVIVCDIEADFPDIEAGTIDCVIFGDVLEHLYDPEAILRRARQLLTPDGVVLVCVPNIGHFSIIKALLRGDPMYQPSGLLDATHIRFFGHATFIKMLLDVGFVPDLVDTIDSGGAEDVVPAAKQLLEQFRVPPALALKSLGAYQYIFAAKPLPDVDLAVPVAPITFVVCVNDEDQLNSNLMRSPCLWPGTPHEVLFYRDQRSAADGFNLGLKEAANELVVLVQQDMYLPLGWDQRFVQHLEQAEREFGPIGVAGLIGITYRGGEPVRHGRAVDRYWSLDCGDRAPVAVDGLDEILLAVRRDSGLRADPALGFHHYGTDLCLTAAEAGLTNVVVDALAYHNSLFWEADRSFHVGLDTLLRKWPETRPLHTCMGDAEAMLAAAPPVREPSREAEQDPELAQLQLRLEGTEQRLAAVLNSRTWRVGQALGKALGRGRQAHSDSPTS